MISIAEKMPILKGEASHYNADLHNLLCCCQCADVAFYPEDLSTAVEAHKIILCSVSHLFMLLFGVKSLSDTHDDSIVQLAQSLFAVEPEDPFPSSPHGAPPCVLPVRVVVKDSVFCSCLPDILHFIYSGTFWEQVWLFIFFCLMKEYVHHPRNVALLLWDDVSPYFHTYFIPCDYYV